MEDNSLPIAGQASAHALERFTEPRNYGPLTDYSGSARITGPCGDTMEFWLQVRDARIAKATFTTTGCGPSRATGSMATELAAGIAPAEAAQIEQQDILTALGGLPAESEHCALLASNTLKAAVADLERKAAELLVLPGKGGVGKSTISVNLASHPHCIVCSANNDKGLGLAFSLLDDGRVEADFHTETWHQGYPGILHGGVVSAVLDGAMTNCLFAHGHLGMTGELNVRFRHPVAVGEDSVVSAWIERCHPPFHLVRAELVQNGKVMARATGKFVNAPVEIAT